MITQEGRQRTVYADNFKYFSNFEHCVGMAGSFSALRRSASDERVFAFGGNSSFQHTCCKSACCLDRIHFRCKGALNPQHPDDFLAQTHLSPALSVGPGTAALPPPRPRPRDRRYQGSAPPGRGRTCPIPSPRVSWVNQNTWRGLYSGFMLLYRQGG